MISQQEFDDAMADLVKAEAEIERLREALKPLAALKLWRDKYPDAIQDLLLDGYLTPYFTVEDVCEARRLTAPPEDK
jgi:hypothetical protein